MKKEIKRNIASLVRKYRKKAKLSQIELGRLINGTTDYDSTVYQIENNRKFPDIKILLALCERLPIPSEEIESALCINDNPQDYEKVIRFILNIENFYKWLMAQFLENATTTKEESAGQTMLRQGRAEAYKDVLDKFKRKLGEL